jgi:hypothetical protein
MYSGYSCCTSCEEGGRYIASTVLPTDSTNYIDNPHIVARGL